MSEGGGTRETQGKGESGRRTPRGLVMIWTGDGKGKTTAALGLVLRAAGHSQRALLIQFLKGTQRTGESLAIQKFLPDVQIERVGRRGFIRRGEPSPEDRQGVARGLELARAAFRTGAYDLIVLDELNVALSYGLASLSEVLDLLAAKRERQHVVITGRGAPAELMEMADLVSVIEEGKHHFRRGVRAQPGVEF